MTTLTLNLPTVVMTSSSHWQTMADDPYERTGTPAPAPARTTALKADAAPKPQKRPIRRSAQKR